jgi:hypothetical protein
MQTVKARFDGKVFVPLAPVKTLKINTPVIVVEDADPLYGFLYHDDYEDYVEKSLMEADAEAETTPLRYTHEEVFGELRKSLQDKIAGV